MLLLETIKFTQKIPIGSVSVDEYVVWWLDGNNRDVLDEGGEGDSWLAEAVNYLQCTLVLGWNESSWSKRVAHLKEVTFQVFATEDKKDIFWKVLE